MRSAIFKGAGTPLAIENVPDPAPAAGEVVIKVARCGICGSDVKMTDITSPVHFACGSALGHEYAGEIVALGRGVSGLAIGDRVTAIPAGGCGSCAACLAGDPYACTACRYIMGGFSEYTRAQALYVAKLPEGLSLSDGALVEPLACGSQAVRLGGVGPESRVLVLGAGPIGLTAVYWAKRAGCLNIAVTAQSSRNAERARAMGASAFVQQGDDLPARVAAALGGPPDVVFECAGAPGLIGRAVACVRPKGTVVSAGMCFEPEPFVAGNALMKQVRLQFSMAYVMDDFRRGMAALEAGHVEPRAMIGETIGLGDVPDMLETLRQGGSRGKVMVDPWG